MSRERSASLAALVRGSCHPCAEVWSCTCQPRAAPPDRVCSVPRPTSIERSAEGLGPLTPEFERVCLPRLVVIARHSQPSMIESVINCYVPEQQVSQPVTA